MVVARLMTLRDLTARVRRLDELSRGLAKEVVLRKECNDPLLYLERRTYYAPSGGETAGVVPGEGAAAVGAGARAVPGFDSLPQVPSVEPLAWPNPDLAGTPAARAHNNSYIRLCHLLRHLPGLRHSIGP
jgi:hypothetical protein